MKGDPIIIATMVDPISGAIVETHRWSKPMSWQDEHFFIARWPNSSPFDAQSGNSPREALDALIAKQLPRAA